MQGRKPEKEIQHVVISHGYAKFSHSMQKSRGRAAAGLSESQFRTLCEISHTLRNHKTTTNEFRIPCEI